jgi:hypothetical protein
MATSGIYRNSEHAASLTVVQFGQERICRSLPAYQPGPVWSITRRVRDALASNGERWKENRSDDHGDNTPLHDPRRRK